MLVDASVAIKWYLKEPGSEAAEALFVAETLAAPDLIMAEVGNGLWKAWRREALSAEAAKTAVRNLTERLSVLHSLGPLAERATEISHGLDHPLYDCLYLACAERTEEQLVTADERLLRTISGTEWQDLCRPLDISV